MPKTISSASVPTIRGLRRDGSYCLSMAWRRTSRTAIQPTAQGPFHIMLTQMRKATIASPTLKMALISKACQDRPKFKGNGTEFKTAISEGQSKDQASVTTSKYSRTLLLAIKHINKHRKEYRTHQAIRPSWAAMLPCRTLLRSSLNH